MLLILSVTLTVGLSSTVSGTTISHEKMADSKPETCADKLPVDYCRAESLERSNYDLSLGDSKRDFIGDDAETVTVLEVDQVDGTATVRLREDGFITVDVSAIADGEHAFDTFNVETLAIIDSDTGDYVAQLRSVKTGELMLIDTTIAVPQAFPALLVLGAVARVGIKAAINQYTKAQVKRAAKSYLLNGLDRNSWHHIMQAKHNWHQVGAKSREQVAEILADAMANGKHSATPFNGQASYWYSGREIVVRYDIKTGKISNGWVAR